MVLIIGILVVEDGIEYAHGNIIPLWCSGRTTELLSKKVRAGCRRHPAREWGIILLLSLAHSFELYDCFPNHVYRASIVLREPRKSNVASSPSSGI